MILRGCSRVGAGGGGGAAAAAASAPSRGRVAGGNVTSDGCGKAVDAPPPQSDCSLDAPDAPDDGSVRPFPQVWAR